MTLTILACLDSNDVMAVNGKQAYVLRSDREFFKSYVKDKLQIASKLTYNELVEKFGPEDYALYSRQNGHDLLAYAAKHKEECAVVGGSVVYAAALGVAQKLLISRAQVTNEANKYQDSAVFFPASYDMLYRKVSTEVCDGYDLEVWKLCKLKKDH